MEHIICMVFNLQYEGKPITYEGDDCWVEQRLKIFKKYCINAFNNQTDPNFHLLIYCDNSTPNPYKNELLELEKNYNFISICWEFSKAYGDDWEKIFKNSILNNIKKLTKKDKGNVICSRFENDDIPEIRYNEYLKMAHQECNIISLGKGLYWDINTDQFLDSVFPTGPFISVKSPLESFVSPLEDQHHCYITERQGTPLITSENLWIQLIHGDNLWNQLDRMPGELMEKPSPEFLETYFSIP